MAMTKAEMEADLRRAVLNTGGRLTRVVLDNGRLATIPSADQIAWAVVAAAREMDVDPATTLKGAEEWRGNASKGERRADLKRARMYAAVALSEVIRETPDAMIARLLNVGAPKTFLWGIRGKRKNGEFEWWDDDVLARVKAKIPRLGITGSLR